MLILWQFNKNYFFEQIYNFLSLPGLGSKPGILVLFSFIFSYFTTELPMFVERQVCYPWM
jgi:hypothetical protein